MDKIRQLIEEFWLLREQEEETPKEPKKEKTVKQKYAVVVAEVVRGKSFGPEGYKKFKPYAYRDPENVHQIVFAKVFEASTDAEAKSEWKSARSQMEKLKDNGYGGGFIRNYGVVLHNITRDEPVEVGEQLADEGYLFDGVYSDNELLRRWGIN